MSNINSLPTVQQLVNWDNTLYEWKFSKSELKVPSETAFAGADTYANYFIVMHDYDVSDPDNPKVIFTWVLHSRDGASEDVFDEAVPFAEILKFHKHNEG